MKRYPINYNPVREYWFEIKTGKTVVCQKIAKVYDHLIWEMEHPEECQYYYDAERANHVLEFAENFCRHSKGKFGGKLVSLELWEKAFLAAAFGFVDIDGNRQFREIILIVAKKNGKSLIASIVGTYMLTADGEAGPEVYAVATKRDQAKIIWSEAKRMIKKSPEMRSLIKPLVAELDSEFNDGVFKPLSSDSDTLDGLNVSCALMDEIHQWKNGRALYDIIADGVSAREQPMIVITTTAGVIREDIYDEKYDEATRIINGYGDEDGYHDDRILPIIYELDSRSEWTDENCWVKANPGLGTIKSRTTLAEKVKKAQLNPMMVKNLVCKEFNIRETSSEAWLTFEELNNDDRFTLDWSGKTFLWNDIKLPYPRYGIGGCDLSSTTDLTAAKVVFMVPGCEKLFVLSMYWIAEELVEKKVREDKIPYDLWIERGLCRTTPGNSVHYKYVKQWFVEIQEKFDIYIPWIGYDSWSAKYFVEDMQQYFGPESMRAVIQGKKTLSDPMKRLANEFSAKKIVYNANPIDKWCFANTSYEEDKNGNIQPHKTSKSTRRIDGLAALLDAYVVFQDVQQDYLSRI